MRSADFAPARFVVLVDGQPQQGPKSTPAVALFLFYCIASANLITEAHVRAHFCAPFTPPPQTLFFLSRPPGTKAADRECAVDRYNLKVDFNHPFVQALGMFLGEFMCWLVFVALSIRAARAGDTSFPRAKPHSRFVYILPALCDMTATSVMYVGLSLTSSSIFQMLRGSVVIFTAILSVFFLKRKLKAHHWIGMVFVLGGTALVGAATYICPAPKTGSNADANATLGNILVIVAQVVVAVQMVVEEKILGSYNIPALQVVGWEGMWGFLMLSIVLVIMYFINPGVGSTFCSGVPTCTVSNFVYHNNTQPVCDHFEDTYDAFVQVRRRCVTRRASILAPHFLLFL